MSSGKRENAVIPVLFVCIISLLLSSCGTDHTQEGSYAASVESSGQALTVIFDENSFSSGTIEAENGEYRFQYETQSGGMKFTVTYPDGCVYFQTEINGGIASTQDYDAGERRTEGYLDLLSLEWAVDSAADSLRNGGKHGGPSIILAFLLLGCGAWLIFAPVTAWRLTRGWWYKDAEPSKAALVVYSLSGVVFLLVGVICLLASF